MELSHPYVDDVPVGNGVWVRVKLNDLQGGHAKITMYKIGPDGDTPVKCTYDGAEFYTSIEYDAGDEDENGEFWASFGDADFYDWDMDSEQGVRYKAKLVVEYTYPDGVSGKWESRVFNQCCGKFARYAKDPAVWYDAENKCLTAEVAIDMSLVEVDSLTIVKTSARWYEVEDISTWLEEPKLTSSYDGKDGTWRMIFTVPLEEFKPGEYTFDVQLLYDPGAEPLWLTEMFADLNLE